MSQQQGTFGQGVAIGVGIAVGIKVIDQLAKVDWGSVASVFVVEDWRANNFGAFDSWIMSNMRVHGYLSSTSLSFWNSQNLTDEEKTRIKAKIIKEAKHPSAAFFLDALNMPT